MDTEKVSLFTNIITSEAQEICKSIEDDIQQKRVSAEASAEDDALADAYRFIKNEVARINIENGREISKITLENRQAQYLRRDTMADEILGDVEKRLQEYTQTADYKTQMTALAKTFLETLKGDVTLRLRPEDKHLESLITALPGGGGVSFAVGTFRLGGLQASNKQKHIDATYDTKLAGLRTNLLELFGFKLAD